MARRSGADDALVLRLATAPGHLLRRAQQVHTDLWVSTVGGDITGPQYSTLVAVAGWPDVDQKRAAELASLDKSTTTGVVARLEKKGLLTRRAHPADARRTLLMLTEDARKSLPGLTAAAAQVQVLLVEPVAEEQRPVLIGLLQKVAFGSNGHLVTNAPNHRDDVLVLAATPGHLIRRAQQVHAAIWSEVFGGDLTGPQYAILGAVAERGPVEQAWVGARTSLDSSTAADIIARLADKGWLTRCRDERDRRRMLIELTPPAMTAMRHLTGAAEEVQKRLLDGLSTKQAGDFVSMMQRVARLESSSPRE